MSKEILLDYLHQHKSFQDILRIVGDEKGIEPSLVEKDYWIMHGLYGLQKLGMIFELKGGTSLSKGYRIIHRFSEDIDIRIEPPTNLNVPIGRNQDKAIHRESRKKFYDWLASHIKIEGISGVSRDYNFDDEKYRSGGIRLFYESTNSLLKGLKEGILLEVGFDDISPNFPKDITSWAYEYTKDKVKIKDNRALRVKCYHPGYTFVEKLQTISTKFRKQQETGFFSENFMRHYYDIYCLLQTKEVQNFIGTTEYEEHKKRRFRQLDNPSIKDNPAFLLKNQSTKAQYEEAYKKSSNLYYQGQPSFNEIINFIQTYIAKL